MAEIQESMVESVAKRGMSDQSNPQADVEAGEDPGFGATGERFIPLDGAQYSYRYCVDEHFHATTSVVAALLTNHCVYIYVSVGVGSLLFEMHSKFFTAPFCEEVKTSLQFYEQVVSILR